eukprot:TRINITY_DN7436_c0_g2_i1.p1 TRINITY_DN7436_c0_g2~~TRINITY_DN7436_c0_g2_i1.p1  ORF type:complete len:541 (-),score=90.80 TRINITY_DN7436_c0_g2_i1:60-1682(-)
MMRFTLVLVLVAGVQSTQFKKFKKAGVNDADASGVSMHGEQRGEVVLDLNLTGKIESLVSTVKTLVSEEFALGHSQSALSGFNSTDTLTPSRHGSTIRDELALLRSRSSTGAFVTSPLLLMLLILLVIVVVGLRIAPAPDNGLTMVHESSIVVDSEFSTSAAAGRFLRALLLGYLTYFMYPGRVYAALHREPAFRSRPKLLFFLAPLTPLYLLYGVTKGMIKGPGADALLEKVGFQADTEEQCIAERERRGYLGRFFHAMYFYTAMAVNTVWAGSCTPSKTTVLSKDHWREVLTSAGAFVPPEVARFKGNKESTWKVDELPDADVVVKPEIGCLGEASACFKKGKDFTTKADLTKKMEEFLDTEAKKPRLFGRHGAESQYLVLERVLPDERGVHLVEVCTAVDANGKVGVLWMTYFLDSNSFTSHSASSRYRVNASTCKIEGGEQWFRRRAMNDDLKTASLRFGEEVPRAREAAELAVKAHEEEIKINPGRKFLGWDCMFTKDQGSCFFEGNTMELRMGRSFYNSWPTLWHIVRSLAPPA